MEERAADRASARRHLEALAATPRPAGSEAEARARAYCAGVLTAAGLAVAEEPFSYSALPGRMATPLLGAFSIAVFAGIGHWGSRGHAGLALGILLGSALVLGVAAQWLIRVGVLALPWMRERSTNLVATRGNTSVWLVAHLDSKSQPIPILVRVLGVIGILVAGLVALAIATLQAAGYEVEWTWPWITGAGVTASLPVLASVVRSRSPGALDDASGVSTALMVAQSLPRQLALGVLLTSAEEMGLAGARAWVRGRGAVHAINIDGIDDDGELRLTWTGQRPAALLELLSARAAEHGVHARTGRMPPGALLDGVALADAGWKVVTVSRGTLETVARIHTAGDSLDRLNGEGVALAASIIVSAIAVGA